VENVKARFAAVTTFSFAHIAATSQIVLAQNIGYLNEFTAGAPPTVKGKEGEGMKKKGEGENGKKEIKQREEIRGMALPHCKNCCGRPRLRKGPGWHSLKQ